MGRKKGGRTEGRRGGRTEGRGAAIRLDNRYREETINNIRLSGNAIGKGRRGGRTVGREEGAGGLWEGKKGRKDGSW